MSKKSGDSDSLAPTPLLTHSHCHILCCRGLISLPPRRSVIVENSASSAHATEILKPVKKRQRKDYQSPSEEEYESEQMVGRGQGGHVCARANVKTGPRATPVCTVVCTALIDAFQCYVISMSKG